MNLPEGFTEILDADTDLTQIWNGSSHKSAVQRDKQLAVALHKYKFSFTEVRAIVSEAPHGSHRNGSELDAILRAAGFHAPTKLTTFEDLEKAMPKGAKQFIWEPWLPRGYMTVLAGQAGQGKTGLALEIARHLLLGEQMPDGKQIEKAESIVWCDTESSQGIVLERSQKWGLPLNQLIIPLQDPLGDFRADNREHWSALLDTVNQCKPAMIVVDSLRGAHTKSENDSDQLQVILTRLAGLAREFAVAVLILHHLRKKDRMEKSSGVTLDQLRGSNAISAMARVVWGIDQPNPEDDARRLSMVKSNLTKSPEPLGFEMTDEGIIWSAAPVEPRGETQVDRAVSFLSIALRRSPKSVLELFSEGEQAGLSVMTLRRAKDRLRIIATKTKGISGRGGWTWGLPAAPRHWTDSKDPDQDDREK